MNKRSGFTIVELLVVIVVIGILAAITIVSYSGISQKAKEASLQSDLVNVSRQFKVFHVDKGFYPATIDCSEPDNTTNKCIKSSVGNTIELCESGAQNFTIVAKNSNLVYKVTAETSPISATLASPIFSTGGEIDDSGCYRTHTFGVGTFTITSTKTGTVDIVINGGGGGGGSDYLGYSGATNGGNSSIAISGGSSYISYGGTFGDNGEGGGGDGVDGEASASGLNGEIGGARNGGGGYDGGGSGGAGGRITGSINVNQGQTLTITVGAGGVGECYTSCGGNGGAGLVTLRYSLY